jgi:hypothetical protein
MSGPARVAAAGLAALALHLAGTLAPAQPAKPEYLRYADFAAGDSTAQLAAKQAYNEAVERYNKALYDYYLTLERHDQLVAAHNRASTPAEQQKARAEAAPLRTKLEALRRDVTAAWNAVDQARRRAAQAGVAVTR